MLLCRKKVLEQAGVFVMLSEPLQVVDHKKTLRTMIGSARVWEGVRQIYYRWVKFPGWPSAEAG